MEGLRRSRFPDVRRDAWYADYVAYLEKLGVVVGYPDGLFHAEATITREQFVAMSVRLDEWMELETYDSRRGSFPDMPVSHWAADYIQEATRNTAETVLPAPRSQPSSTGCWAARRTSVLSGTMRTS